MGSGDYSRSGPADRGLNSPRAAGVDEALCILAAGDDAEAARAARVRAAWPGVRFSAGIHPHQAGEWAGREAAAVATVRAAVRELARASLAEALREIGDVETPIDVVWPLFHNERLHRETALSMHLFNAFATVRMPFIDNDVVGNDEHVVQLLNVTAARGGRTLEYRTAEIYHMRGGKITARWAFSEDTARILEFFGS